MKIDSHQHFWSYEPVKDAWISDAMPVLKKDYLPRDLKPLLEAHNFDGCIAVQADQSETETHFLLELAKQHPFIKGVVGWVDLCSPNISERLEYFSQFKLLKGFRHIIQAEKQADFILRDDFCMGISLLEKYNFTYDILVVPSQLSQVLKFVKRFANQAFVIDHLAKPDFKSRKFEDWKTYMRQIAEFENVYCKVSGLATEADWKNWKQDNFTEVLNITTDAFGPDRLMFGSDWPVCLLAADYGQTLSIIQKHFSGFSQEEQSKIWGLNAVGFYGL